MSPFVLDASYALAWCFEDESTPETEAILSVLQNEQTTAIVPFLWPCEMLNGLGKGITRKRIALDHALHFWHELSALPIRVTEIFVDNKLLELSLHHLAVYDTLYLALAKERALPLATQDEKLKTAAVNSGVSLLTLLPN